ncbi:MAG TPA: SRPBCC domain-containing protein, partial [Puia sp.]|nr:SRPBCC domain-containing protein [Puia sp.]
VENKRVVWKIEDSWLHVLHNKKEWDDTEIIWEVIPQGNNVKITMRHDGLLPELECYANCEIGWNFFVKESLYNFLTGLKPLPFNDTHLTDPGITDPQNIKPDITVNLNEGIVRAEMDFPLQPQFVFDSLTKAEEIEHWWGAENVYRMEDWKADLRPGGKYSVNVRRSDGQVFPASGKFIELDFPNSIVHTRNYDWDHPNLGRRETIIHYRLDPISNGTHLTVVHEGFTACHEAAVEHGEGWERVLNWLYAHLYYNFYFPKKNSTF